MEPFKQFILPEDRLSLKLVFDNVRNYAICGALLSLAFWFRSGKATPPPLIFTGPPLAWWPLEWMSLAAFAILFGFNAYQTILIVLRLWGEFIKVDKAESKGPSTAPWYIWILYYLLALPLLALVFGGIWMIALLVIYIPWFTAVGTH